MLWSSTFGVPVFATPAPPLHPLPGVWDTWIVDESVIAGVKRIFDECRRLSELTGRPFSPDGHLVGSLGEVFAAETLNLRLMTPSNRGFDAVDDNGQKVEIKATTRTSIALSAAGTDAKRLVVVQFDENGQGRITYDGPADAAWNAAGPPQANGQRQISVATLKRLAEGTQDSLFTD